MSIKLMEQVYGLRSKLTTSSEQAVLLALAFSANEKTGLCFPKQDTLVAMTHLSRASVSNALNALRAKGLLNWKSGGLKGKKGKYGKTLSNDYTFTLPPGNAAKRERNSQPSVQQLDTNRNNKGNSNSNTDTNIGTTGIVSGLNLDDSAKALGHVLSANRAVQTPNNIEASSLLRALRLCHLTPGDPTYYDNYRAFSNVMLQIEEKHPGRSMEIIIDLESRQRQGELDTIDKLPAFVMSRLKNELKHA